jgi:hypothetical protein
MDNKKLTKKLNEKKDKIISEKKFYRDSYVLGFTDAIDWMINEVEG